MRVDFLICISPGGMASHGAVGVWLIFSLGNHLEFVTLLYFGGPRRKVYPSTAVLNTDSSF